MPGSCDIPVAEKLKTVRKPRKKPPQKRRKPPLKRPAPARASQAVSVAVDPEAAQELADGLNKLKDLMMSTPGFMQSLKEVLVTISKGYPDVAVVSLMTSEFLAISGNTFTLEACRHILEKFGEVLMQAGIAKGREEVMKEYALECLSKCLDPETGE